VSVHYIGTLQDGTEFDNSKKRGAPFEFKVGEGRVIAGWEEGLVGMQVGGQRVLVIPPEKAYGSNGVGPIPGNATLVFSIELLEIK
jgi:FKBP-type peptidyl-prolyl cis-trans isomerase